MTQWGLDTLFNPAKRHMDDEKRRLQSTREEVGDNSGGKRIDLESGKVHISRGDDEPGDPEATEADPRTASRTTPRKAARDVEPAKEVSPAAARAAKRRARKT